MKKVNLREERLGKSFVNKQGEKATCVEYYNRDKIVVEFEDGMRVNTTWYSFSKGSSQRDYKKDRLGTTFINKRGEKATCVEYNSSSDITIKFDNGSIYKTTWNLFSNNSFGDKKKVSRLGEVSTNNQGLKMKIVAYRRSDDIDIEFENGFIAKGREYRDFKIGNVKNILHPSIFGVGYFGEGEYKAYVNKQYTIWISMLKRCYDEKSRYKEKTYADCTVCSEWHNFQNFAKWCDENYYEIPNKVMALDKDILIKGNKVYSPSTCVFVSQEINSLFTKNEAKRNKLPIGVSYNTEKKVYISQLQKEGVVTFIGHFSDPEEAFYAYKKAKEEHIKYIADKYKQYIPEKLYNAMYAYEVEITD